MFFAHVSLCKESWIFLSISYFRRDSLSVGHQSGSDNDSGVVMFMVMVVIVVVLVMMVVMLVVVEASVVVVVLGCFIF